MRAYVPMLILLVILAASTRDDFALTLVYLFVGAFALATWWSRRGLGQMEFTRKFTGRAFLGDKVSVEISLRNRGWLPVPWASLREALPVGLSSSPVFEQVTGLGPRAEQHYQYTLEARKRGYYPLGPLSVATGDILGLSEPLRHESAPEYLTVYPQIVPLSSIKIPSRSPNGTLRHTQPIFEDPTRVMGKREYVSGDSLRRVDWKSTAATGQMQVKLFEPSIALETLIFLNLNADDYHYRTRIDSTELAVVIAASVAAWVASKGQTVGMNINGKDPLMADGRSQSFPPRKGRAHLMRMLESLARVDLIKDSALPAILQRERYQLSWGSTLIVITGQVGDDLLAELYQARTAGQNTLLVLAGPVPYEQDIIRRAWYYGIPVVSIPNERGLDVWRT